MRITLDWDEQIPAAPEDSRFGSMLSLLRDRYDDQPWELRKSSSGDGWHFLVYGALNDTRRGFAQSLARRERFGDDTKRLRLDRKRWQLDSPFPSVLYRRKYMDRDEWPAEDGTGYSTGHAAEVIEQNDEVKAAPERERIKQDGRLDYNKITELLVDRYEGGVSELAKKQDVSRRSIYRWLNGSGISTSNRKGLRRKARSQALGHYAETPDGSGKAAQDVRYVDREDERRTLVEYVDVPLDFDIGGDDREYGLLNIHTGTYNDNHGDRQLQAVHEDVVEHTLDELSPTSPDGTSLNVEDRNESFAGVSGWTREQDSVNYERELLDDGEAGVYLDNLPASDADPSQYPIFEVILWDEDMRSIEWQVIGLWTGSRALDAEVLRDVGLGSWK